MNTFPFVPANHFTPNNSGWSTIGKIDSWDISPNSLKYTFKFGSRSLYIEVIGDTAYRLRFNPAENATYQTENSTAVVNRDLGLTGLTVDSSQSNSNQVIINTGTIRIQVDLDPFYVQVYKGSQLISQDAPGQGILYIPGQEVIAIMKSSAPNAQYLGLGEKAGSKLLKNDYTFTFFNFDNYTYSGPDESGASLGTPGPLNPSVPLYCSIPFLIENNPMVTPGQPFAGDPFATGTFLDNPGQSYANIMANDYSDMSGKFYLGALYNEIDVYFFAGDGVANVLTQYTDLTGRSPMPPRYAFGFQQGAYGYYDRYKLSAAANSYRAARIPCDGLHIDVDFQDNYRTFTHSKMKFPNCKELFDDLHTIGFKMSTNITPIITDNELNQEGMRAAYEQRDTLIADNALIYNTRYQSGEGNEAFLAGVFYGNNRGNNPYPSPPNQFNSDGLMPLAAPGNYPDFGLTHVRETWGAQYQHLIQDLGLDMIWQDMTCPALDANLPPEKMYFKTFPQDLMMAQENTDAAGNVTVVYKPNAKLHNSYVNNLLDATWSGINKLAPQRRNFIIARGGYAGMQRYAALWTGDSASSWDFLKINLPEVLNIGLSGVPISGCDIGGFANGSGTTSESTIVNGTVVGGITNYELLTRWMQLGSFLPWYRNHYDGYNKQFQEAYAYAEPVPSNCRKYVELRYQMMQVYYDAMYQWTKSGLPIARPLFLNEPTDSAVYQHSNDQFFVGGDILVAPMLFQAETANPPISPTRGIYLPSNSDWYAFQNNQSPLVAAVSGGTYISDYYANLSLVPIYIRAGAILPFGEVEQWVGELESNPITLNCYPGPDRWTDEQAYEMYQDDGISIGAEQKGEYRLSKVYQQTQNKNGNVTRNIRISHIYDKYQPPANYNYIAILGSITTAKSVYRDGELLMDVGNPTALSTSTTDSWYWNQSLNTVFVKVYDNTADSTVSANY